MAIDGSIGAVLNCGRDYRKNSVQVEPTQRVYIVEKGGCKVNKNELISAVASRAEMSKADATKAVDGVFDSITNSLSSGGEVRIVGFGTFSVANRKATTGRNPRTGESIQIPASRQPKFKAGKALKESVN